jgi:hypothetical protein
MFYVLSEGDFKGNGFVTFKNSFKGVGFDPFEVF